MLPRDDLVFCVSSQVFDEWRANTWLGKQATLPYSFVGYVFHSSTRRLFLVGI